MKDKATKGGSAHFSIKDHFKAIERVRQGLKEAILACPGPSKESGIKHIGAHCCTVSFHTISKVGSWAADSYIFPAQYKALAELISKGESDTIVKRLLKALRDGGVKGRDGHSLKLHPEVVANVRKMLKEKE